MTGGAILTVLQSQATDERASSDERIGAVFQVLDAPLRAWMRKQCRGQIDGDSIIGDTWAKVTGKFDTFVMPSNDPHARWAPLSAWVYQIAANRAIDIRRHHEVRDRVDCVSGPMATGLALRVADRTPSIEDQYEQSETARDQRQLIDEILRTRTPRERACVLLEAGVPETRQDVMDRFGMSKAAVKAMRHRMFKTLRRELVELNACLQFPVEGIPVKPMTGSRKDTDDELIRPEHWKRIGPAIGLYRYLHDRCLTSGDGARTSVATYTHQDAAMALRRDVFTIYRWMARLVKGGYVTTRAIPDGLIVTITGYVAHTTIEGTQDAC